MTQQVQVAAKVYVQGMPFREITENIFKFKPNYKIVKNLKDADIVVWTGGEDIFPGLYGEKAIPGVYYSKHRDESDVMAVEQAFAAKKFLVGICRGAQLLNVVPNGGKLWQDVDGHGSCLHRAFDCVSGKYIMVNSVHHQMLRLTDKAQMVCWAEESKIKRAQSEIWTKPSKKPDGSILEKDKDVEAAFYPDTRSLLIQSHPEFGHPPTTKYFFDTLMSRYYWGN